MEEFDEAAIMREVVTIFRRSLPERHERLRAALEAGNREALAREVHRLRGAAGTAGFTFLFETASAIDENPELAPSLSRLLLESMEMFAIA